MDWDSVNKIYELNTSLFIIGIKKLASQGTYKLEKWRMDGRLDYISYNIYKTTKLWWVLMLYNSIDRFYNVKYGTELSYPSFSSVENFIISLKNSTGMWI